MLRISIICFTTLGLIHLGNVKGREGIGAGEQEWGYAKVRPGANMFWWLYFTTNSNVTSFFDKPLIIWVEGGPGTSATGYGNFLYLGPYDSNLHPRNHTWVKDYNVLFIDNPVGTGFSYTESPDAFATTNTQISLDLLETIRQIFEKFPEFSNVPTYIAGHSYGGKMGVELALEWYKAQKSGSISSNLKGIAFGNGFISPLDTVISWAPYLLYTGMIDTEGFKRIEKSANDFEDAVNSGKWSNATQFLNQALKIIVNETGMTEFFNILTPIQVDNTSGYITALRPESLNLFEDVDFLMGTVVSHKFGLNVTWNAQRHSIQKSLFEDGMKPVTHIVERLLEETDLKILVFTGHLDLLVNTPGTLRWVENLRSTKIGNWKSSKRSPLVVNGTIEGYVKKYENFSFYWINRAGHTVVVDNVAATSAILEHLCSSST